LGYQQKRNVVIKFDCGHLKNRLISFCLPVSAAQCLPSWVHISGQIHFTVHGMINGNRISLVQHGNCQGLSRVGLSSHKHYAGLNVFNDIYNGNFAGSYTAISSSSVRLNASGSDNNLTVVVRTKTTVNGNGDVTASHLEDAMSCQ
jgi:hypothetical protein